LPGPPLADRRGRPLLGASDVRSCYNWRSVTIKTERDSLALNVRLAPQARQF